MCTREDGHSRNRQRELMRIVLVSKCLWRCFSMSLFISLFFNCFCVSFCFVILRSCLASYFFDGYFSFNSHSVFLFFFQFGLLLFSLFLFVLVFQCLARKCCLTCMHRSRMPSVCCSRLRNVGLSELSGTVKKVAPRKASCPPSARCVLQKTTRPKDPKIRKNCAGIVTVQPQSKSCSAKKKMGNTILCTVL